MQEGNKNPVGWFEIYVDDMPRAKAFYEAIFGITLEKLNAPDTEMWSFPGDQSMTTYGAGGALAKMEGYSPGKNSVLVYFSCADCGVEESRVEGAGGKVEQSKQSLGEYGYMSLVYDTEGNMIGLHSMN